MWWCRIALGVALLAVAGCSFRPLYGERADGARERLAAVAINPIRDRIGYEVYNLLRDSLTPRGAPAAPLYTLAVELSTNTTPLITERDSQIRRFDLNVRARYSLFDIATGGEMHSGAYRATASYNVVESAAFATRMAEEDAARKAAREVSRGIATALALYFERHGAN
jgi:LPS-assembly lipoprotein